MGSEDGERYLRELYDQKEEDTRSLHTSFIFLFPLFYICFLAD
jgi:hypothetical protein